MPARNPPPQPLTLDARKHLLLVACTLDRFEFGLGRRRPSAPVQLLETVVHLPWFDLVANLASRVLPRRARFVVSLARLVRRTLPFG